MDTFILMREFLFIHLFIYFFATRPGLSGDSPPAPTHPVAGGPGWESSAPWEGRPGPIHDLYTALMEFHIFPQLLSSGCCKLWLPNRNRITVTFLCYFNSKTPSCLDRVFSKVHAYWKYLMKICMSSVADMNFLKNS